MTAIERIRRLKVDFIRRRGTAPREIRITRMTARALCMELAAYLVWHSRHPDAVERQRLEGAAYYRDGQAYAWGVKVTWEPKA